MSVAWRCSVCGSAEVRVVPAGGPFGVPSRPVSGVWVSCLGCFRWAFRPFASPVPLSSVLPQCGVFRHDAAKVEPPQEPAPSVLERYGYQVNPETGEITSAPKPSVTSQVLDHVLGPKTIPRGTLAHKALNTKRLTGWKLAIGYALFAAVVYFLVMFTLTDMFHHDALYPQPGVTCHSEWVDEEGWTSICDEKGE